MDRMTAKHHDVTVVGTDPDSLHFTVDGVVYRIRWTECSGRLANASHGERALMEVSPSGYGIHWPLLDEDLAIDPLVVLAEQIDVVAA